MIESVFYFQIIMFVAILAWGLYTKSASFIALAGVFSILTGVMLVGDGIDYVTGWSVAGADDNHMSITEDYSKHFIANSEPVNMWHYVLLYGGFVWIIIALVVTLRGRQGEMLEED